jgi:hypothetical protein
MTDPEIAEIVFREVIGRDGSEAERAEAIDCYLGHLADAVSESEGYRVMPGIEALLSRLAADGVLLGIVTGNIQPAARIKLARGDLNRFFAFGGYGSDSRDRTVLTSKALERGATVTGTPRPSSPSATPRATSRPATAPESASSASPPVPTRSRSSPKPGPIGRSRPSSPAFRPNPACTLPGRWT